MDLLKKHVDTVIILTGILSSVIWMNSQFNALNKEITVIKTVLIMRGILPNELAVLKNVEDGDRG